MQISSITGSQNYQLEKNQFYKNTQEAEKKYITEDWTQIMKHMNIRNEQDRQFGMWNS